MLPEHLVTRRHDIGVTRKAEIGSTLAATRIKVLDPGPATIECKPRAFEAKHPKRPLEHRHGTGIMGRHAPAPDQIKGQGKGIGKPVALLCFHGRDLEPHAGPGQSNGHDKAKREQAHGRTSRW
jgi:hypothetical protein